MNNNEKWDEFYRLCDEFKAKFNTVPSTASIFKNYSLDHLIESMKKCLEDGVNYLPEIYGYGKHESGVFY
jgi:hypothetical protein